MSAPLESNINYYISDEIMYGVASGELKLNEMFQQVEELIKIAREKNLNKFLFDHRNITLTFKKSEIFHLSHQLDEIGLKTDDKIAILLPDDEFFHQWYTRFETSSVFHGNKVKIFNDEGNALEWLKR